MPEIRLFQRAAKEINGLILYAVLSSTLKDALRYSAADGTFIAIRLLFDTDKDGKVAKAEFDADTRKVRERMFKGAGFDELDPNKDGYFTVEDMRTLRKGILDAVESNNFDGINAWLKVSSAVSLPNGWVKDHFAQPNMWSFLSKLDIPIGLFHGDADNLTPIEGVKKLEEMAKQAGKSNMEFHYFDGLDHSLGIGAYFVRSTMPAGHKAIFEFVKKQSQN